VADGGDQWLEQIGILNNTSANIFAASAILIGFGDSLRTSEVVNALCNRCRQSKPQLPLAHREEGEPSSPEARSAEFLPRSLCQG